MAQKRFPYKKLKDKVTAFNTVKERLNPDYIKNMNLPIELTSRIIESNSEVVVFNESLTVRLIFAEQECELTVTTAPKFSLVRGLIEKFMSTLLSHNLSLLATIVIFSV